MFRLSLIIISIIILSFSCFCIASEEKECPQKPDAPGKIEIRAIMMNCEPQKFSAKLGGDSRIQSGEDAELSEFHGYDKDEIIMHSAVTECKRKMVITMRLKNDKKTVTEEQFVVVDHVYDPVFKKRSRLLNPFVFKIKQNQVLQLYGLQFYNIVNGEVTEEVINKNRDNFTGCDTTSSRPTCGLSMSKSHEIIPYSEGFCCSCDALINHRRQPTSNGMKSPSIHSIGASPIHVKSFARPHRDTSNNSLIDENNFHGDLGKRKVGGNGISGVQDELSNEKSVLCKVGEDDSSNLLERDKTNFQAREDFFKQLYRKPDIDHFGWIGMKNSSDLNAIESASRKGDFETKYSRTDRESQKLSTDSKTRVNKLTNTDSSDGKSMTYYFNNKITDGSTNFENKLESMRMSHSKRASNLLHLFKSDVNNVGDNSIFNSHENLKPVSIKETFNKNAVQTPSTTANLNNFVVREDAECLEPAIGFKASDRRQSGRDPWEVHTTLCPSFRRNPTSNRILHYLKFGDDRNVEGLERAGSASEMEHCNRLAYKPDELDRSDRSDIDNTRLHRINSSRRVKKTKSGLMKSGEVRKKGYVKRQALPNGNQIRGGQSCVDRSTPPGVNPITYHESAHCLRFSDLWYTVYHLRQPFLEHSVRLKLYEKYDFPDKSTHWNEITARTKTNLGTFNNIVQDETPTFSFTYMPNVDQPIGPFTLDTDRSTLLVPQPVSEKLEQKYPQAKAGPSEYLLLKSDQISFDGDECDKVGVSFSAFAKQADRCARVRGSCLKNQPLHLWKHDHDAMAKDKPGLYFLKNYAQVSTSPFLINRSNSDEFLAIEYYKTYTATIEIEVRSDFNGVIRPGTGGQIPSVFVDATCKTNTKIVVTIANMGLAASSFFPKLSNCPGGLPEVWLTTFSRPEVIAPQHHHTFHLSLFGELPIGRFHCSIDVVNEAQDVVATRRIRIQRSDRCLCLQHCLCACIASSTGLSCQHMSVDLFHAAGYLGSLPALSYTNQPKTSKLSNQIQIDVHTWAYILLIFFVAPLLLGIGKAVLGLCCCTSIGSFGMWMYSDGENPRKMKASNANKKAGKETEDSEEPFLKAEFFLNICIFFYLLYWLLLKFSAILCTACLMIICCCGFCPCVGGLGNQKEARFQKHMDSDLDPDDPDYEAQLEGKRGKKKGEDGAVAVGAESGERGQVGSYEAGRRYGVDDFNDIESDDSETDLLEYFTTPLDEYQVRKMVKKFKHYYKEHPPDQTEAKDDDEVLSEYETKLAETFIDLLLESEEVYRHFDQPVGDIIMPEGAAYCIRGFLVKSETGYFFIPPSPLMQYWTHDNRLMEPPQPLAFVDFEKAYDSAIDVLISYDLDLMPNGPTVNCYHL